MSPTPKQSTGTGTGTGAVTVKVLARLKASSRALRDAALVYNLQWRHPPIYMGDCGGEVEVNAFKSSSMAKRNDDKQTASSRARRSGA